MKKTFGLLAGLILLSAGDADAQYEDKRNIIKLGAQYQVFGIEGIRTEAAAWGFSFERSTGYFTAWTLDFSFIERIEDPEDLYNSVPQYNDLFHTKVGFRRYFDESLKGPWAGGAVAMAIPKNNGMSWELMGNIGYQFRHKRVAIEALADIGIGSMRYSEDRYVNGILVSQEKFYGVGFLLRPVLRLGLAL